MMNISFISRAIFSLVVTVICGTALAQGNGANKSLSKMSNQEQVTYWNKQFQWGNNFDIVMRYNQQHNGQMRRSIYYTAKMEEKIRFYDKLRHPHNVRKLGKNRADQMRKEQIAYFDSSIRRELKGASIGTKMLINAAAGLATLLPGRYKAIGIPVSVAIKHGFNREGKIPKNSGKDLRGLGAFVAMLKVTDPEVYEYIKRQYRDESGLDIEGGVDNHIMVEQFRLIEGSNDKIGALEKMLKSALGKQKEYFEEMQKLISSSTNLTPDQKKQLIQEAQKQKMESTYKTIKAKQRDVSATIGTLGIIAELAGKEEIAVTINQVGQFVNQVYDIQWSHEVLSRGRDDAEISEFTLTFDYFSLGLTAVNLIQSLGSSGKSFEQSVMDMLQEILDQILKLSHEMHNRFDRIDQKLAKMSRDMEALFSEIKNNQEKAVLRDEKIIADLNEIKYLILATKKGQVIDNVDSAHKNCLSDSETIHEKKENGEKFREECITVFSNHSSVSITASALGVTGAKSESWLPKNREIDPSMDLWGFFDEYDKRQLVDYNAWVENSGHLLELYYRYPQYRSWFVEGDFTAVVEKGEYFQAAHKALMFEGDELNSIQIRSALSEYHVLMATLIKNAYEKSYSPEYFGAYGLNPFLGFDEQPANISWSKLKLDWCSPTERGTIADYRIDRETYQAIVPQVAQEVILLQASTTGQNFLERQKFFGNMHLPGHFHSYLPNEVLWLMKLDPDHTHVCLSAVNMSHMYVKINSVSADRSMLYETNSSGVAHIGIFHDSPWGDRVHVIDAQFPVGNNVPIRGAGYYQGTKANYQARFHDYGLYNYMNWLFNYQNYHIETPFVPEVLGDEAQNQVQFKNFVDRDAYLEHLDRLYFLSPQFGANSGFVKAFMDRISKDFHIEIAEINSKLEKLYFKSVLALNPNLDATQAILGQFFKTSGLMTAENVLDTIVRERLSPEEAMAMVEASVANATTAYDALSQEGVDGQARLIELNLRLEDLKKAQQDFTGESNSGSWYDKIMNGLNGLWQ